METKDTTDNVVEYSHASEFEMLKITKDKDAFRQAAIFFEKYNCYTFAPKGTSEWIKYWERELNRCKYGFTTDDGEVISGYNYFYLNYTRIMLVKDVKKQLANGKFRIKSERLEDFPRFYDYDRAYFDAIEKAELEEKHLIVLKARGKGYSFKGASMLARNYICFANSKSYAMASEAEFLTKDGLLTKAWDMIEWINQNTALYKSSDVKNTSTHKRASYNIKNSEGVWTEAGYKSEIMGVTLKNDPQKAHPYSEYVPSPKGPIKWEHVQLGTRLFDNNGNIISVVDTHEFGKGDVYEIVFNDGRKIKTSLDHEWSCVIGSGKQERIVRLETRDIIERLKLSPSNRLVKFELPKSVPYFHRDVLIDPYTLGLMLGDGSIGKSTNSQSQLTMKWDDVDAIKEFIPYEVNRSNWGGDIRNVINIENGRDIYKEYNLFDKRSDSKFIPDVYKYNSEEIRFGIINGLLDSDGHVTKDYGVIEYVSKSKQLASDFIELVHSLGIGGRINEKIVNNTTYYRCYVYAYPEENRLFKLPRKKERIALKKDNPYANNKRKYITITAVNKLTEQEELKCITVNSDNSQYLVGDFIPTFNSRGKRAKLILYEEAGKFKDLKTTWQVARPSVEEDGKAYGLMIAFGTGGGADDDFEGLKELFYEPDAYNCSSFDNVWDEGLRGNGCGFFVPQSANMTTSFEGNRLMDDNGNTNFFWGAKAVLAARQHAMTASDRRAVDRHIAEQPLTPEEACLNVSTNIFPLQDLTRHLAMVRNDNKFKDYRQAGDLEFDENGVVKFSQADRPRDLRKYKLNRDDDRTGQVVIWEHPMENPPYGLYIMGIDPYDHDKSGTDSLGSAIIYKRFQSFEKYYDMPVAEYTGRPDTANDFYEVIRKMLMYYRATALYENEKKGLFFYFEKMNCTHLLADQPDIINDIIKDSKVQRKKGIHMNSGIKDWGEGAIRDWLIEEYAEGRKNLTKILSEPLLEELIAYNDEGNFDRVMAFMMVMIYRTELQKIRVKKKEPNKDKLFDKPIFGFEANDTRRSSNNDYSALGMGFGSTSNNLIIL